MSIVLGFQDQDSVPSQAGRGGGLFGGALEAPWLWRALSRSKKLQQQKLDRLQAMEVDCAVRPPMMGSLEEGLTMPLPIARDGLGGECKS